MTITPQRAVGWALGGAGISIAVFSQKIVFPGLESLLGIEAIVGKQNVVYFPDGGYVYTNPGEMLAWVSSVAAFGVSLVCIGGALVFRSRCMTPDSKCHRR